MTTDQKKLRVLVVENEMLLQLAAEDMLQELGHEVVGWANRASGAIAETEKARPDFVLMDIELDGTRDGIEAAHQIKEKFGIESLFVTGSRDEDTYRRAQEVQPIGFLEKPLWLPDLKSALAPFARSRSRGRQDARAAGSARSARTKSPTTEANRRSSSGRPD